MSLQTAVNQQIGLQKLVKKDKTKETLLMFQ